LNDLISGFLRDTEAVVPVRNPAYDPDTANPDPLQGWKARGCEATVRDGAVTVIGKSNAPFLGVALGRIQGPAVLRLRARSRCGGEGKIEWLPAGTAGRPGDARSVPFTMPEGDWHELRVDVPGQGRLGIVRVYLPAQEQPVEIDWIELAAGGKPRKWDFQ
jgi:hypothetical protein